MSDNCAAADAVRRWLTRLDSVAAQRGADEYRDADEYTYDASESTESSEANESTESSESIESTEDDARVVWPDANGSYDCVGCIENLFMKLLLVLALLVLPGILSAAYHEPESMPMRSTLISAGLERRWRSQMAANCTAK